MKRLKILVTILSLGAVFSIQAGAGDKGNGTNIEQLNRIINDELMANTQTITEDVLDSIIYQYGEDIKGRLLLPAMKYFIDNNTVFKGLEFYKHELMKVKKDLLLSIKATPIIYGKCPKEKDIMCTENRPFNTSTFITLDKDKILDFKPVYYTDVITFNKIIASILHEYTHHFMGDYDDRNDLIFTKGMMKVVREKHFFQKTFKVKDLLIKIGKGKYAFPLYDGQFGSYNGRNQSAWEVCASKGYKSQDDYVRSTLSDYQALKITGTKEYPYVYRYDTDTKLPYGVKYMSTDYDSIITELTCSDYQYDLSNADSTPIDGKFSKK